MLRRVALTILPSVALFTIAALVVTSVAPRAQATLGRTLSPTMTPAPQLAARSGYIVASS